MEPEAIHRIVPPCFLTGGTLRADECGVHLPGIIFGRKKKREGRSIEGGIRGIAFSYTELKAFDCSPTIDYEII